MSDDRVGGFLELLGASDAKDMMECMSVSDLSVILGELNRLREQADKLREGLKGALAAIDAHDTYRGVCDTGVTSDENMAVWRRLVQL